MIFVPEPIDCITYNRFDENQIYIVYAYKGNQDYLIEFNWHKFKDKNEFDPFYLEVDECMHTKVLRCSYAGCNCLPQLRYNNIIDKWYCNCASSALGTKNTDESELETLLKDKEYSKKNGFCNNPIEAILRWNIEMAESYKYAAKNAIKKYNGHSTN